ncbi:hypothetical protein L5515_006107 [Caenorhabditis briggsae]|uniref:Uncharacterized protein n=1 Tax=Caenorhabditis briggsae TaxID=6238 RepID=A0AAE9F1R8_CAEBR|nr:hypothetical protein L5515_006107 [Caenorhabditis briggsae]
MVSSSKKMDSFATIWKTNCRKFNLPLRKAKNLKTPEHSMAWVDAKNGPIITEERMRTCALPKAVCRMFADDAKQRRQPRTVEVRGPPHLLALNLSPPMTPPKDEKEILDVLTRINTLFGVVSRVYRIPLCACIERRKVDNAMCLFTYFEQIPWALMGGMTMIPEASVRKLLPPESIYNAWRCQFFQSLQYLLPQMIFSRIARFVDRGVNLDWCTEVITGEQFREVIQRVRKAKLNPMYTILWTTKPTDFDPRNQQFANARSALIRQMEAEVKSLWTYETIGMYLKMYF